MGGFYHGLNILEWWYVYPIYCKTPSDGSITPKYCNNAFLIIIIPTVKWWVLWKVMQEMLDNPWVLWLKWAFLHGTWGLIMLTMRKDSRKNETRWDVMGKADSFYPSQLVHYWCRTPLYFGMIEETPFPGHAKSSLHARLTFDYLVWSNKSFYE